MLPNTIHAPAPSNDTPENSKNRSHAAPSAGPTAPSATQARPATARFLTTGGASIP